MRRRHLLLLAAVLTVLAGTAGPALAVVTGDAAPARAAGVTAADGGRDVGTPAPGSGYVELTNLSYGSDPAELLDAYLPESAGAALRPAVLVIHGGGWQSGSRSDMASQSAAIARAGMVAVNIDYPLDTAGGHGFPQELTAAEAAVSWVKSHASLLRVDSSRVGALGASAGANLSLELGAANAVSAVVSWSAPTDLAQYERAPYGPCEVASCGALSLGYAVYHYLGCLPSICPATYAAASPETHLRGSHAAYLVWNSANELIPLVQADEFVSAARQAGLLVQERVVPGHLHAGAYSSRALADSVSFLSSQLG
jgi:acetyl esterase/lipase